MFQMGLGILGANRPGISAGQAIGQGAMLGMENVQAAQARKEMSAFRKLRAEQLQRQMEMAKQQAEVMQGLAQSIGAPPEEQAGPLLPGQEREMTQPTGWYADPTKAMYAPFAQAALAGGDLGTAFNIMQATQPQAMKPTDDIREYEYAKLSGYGGSFQDWMQLRKPAGTKVTVAPTFYPPPQELEKGVTKGLQEDIVSASTSLPLLQDYIAQLEALPSGAGGIAEAMESAAGIAGQLGSFGVPGAESLAGMLSQETEYESPLTGQKRYTTPQTIQTTAAALKTALRPVASPDAGLLNRDEQRDFDAALARLDSRDAKQRIEASKTIMAIMDRKKGAIEKFLRTSGAPVPGEVPIPRVTNPDELKRLPSGTMFIAPNGEPRIKK